MTLRNSTYTHSTVSLSSSLSLLCRPGPQWSALLSSTLAQRCPTMSTESQVRLPRCVEHECMALGERRAVRKCAGKLLAKSLCQVPPPPLAEYDALFRELRVTSDEFTTLTKCLHFGRNCLLNCFSLRLVKCVFPVRARVYVSVRVLSPTLTAQHMRNLFA